MSKHFRDEILLEGTKEEWLELMRFAMENNYKLKANGENKKKIAKARKIIDKYVAEIERVFENI